MGSLYKKEYLEYVIVKLLPTTNGTNIFEDKVIFDYFTMVEEDPDEYTDKYGIKRSKSL